ncbi:hypothetical protein BDU57DRAFT_510279 [Ampelomyces quisqualis]|uniref:Uncharacterized protein n=1 Tax=Ampelomyces quisqualis TaxID=50730 RepID=A0A6A5R3A7_AMPQU|nr:hypothetical protein BDU57DRAFT_510279 [Ampelomyces quisqualis]
MQIIPADAERGGKQSWSEWVGGYSVAISRAVKTIEHEAAVENQRTTGHGSNDSGGGGGGRARTTKSPAATAKRPVGKTKISADQVDALMR